MWLLFFLGVGSIAAEPKVPYTPGFLCNFEAYYSVQIKVLQRFFCTPESHCRKGVHRFPLMPYDGCNSYMSHTSGELVVCCHEEEIQQDRDSHWKQVGYLPGVRSFMMCRDHSHTICSPRGTYCQEDELASNTVLEGLPTLISKYPHTALIGYKNEDINSWKYFCQGSIISKKFVLTLWTCLQDGDDIATHVKVGESRVCPQKHCPDLQEEQVLLILDRIKQNTSLLLKPYDFALVEVSPTIQFNKKVRPACLENQLNTRQTMGWFARYGKPELYIKTPAGHRPIFTHLLDKVYIGFKVKTAGEARILLSRSGLPHKNEFFYEIILGAHLNSQSTIRRSDEGYKLDFDRLTLNILSRNEFRGFWIKIEQKEIILGNEDSKEPIMTFQDFLDLEINAVGFNTPNATGEWVVYDHTTLASLHEFQMEDTFSDDCKEQYKGDDEVGNSDAFFCAKHPGHKFRPCDNDWGGAIQVTFETFPCMWWIFGVYVRESPQNCSAVGRPALFTTVNRASVLNWIENTAFSNFSITSLNLEDPECVGVVTATDGRCIKPF